MELGGSAHGGRVMSGKRPPTHDFVGESDDDRRTLSSRTPTAREPQAAPRRDPRADPDDEGSGTSRVDIVDVDRSEQVSGAANSLRRDLAKLHLQAAAVERTIDEHRRERADAMERLERATEHALQLEVKLQQAEGEAHSLRRMHEATLEDVHKLRNEKEALEQALQHAHSSGEENQRLKNEIEKLREAREEAARSATTFEAELGEIRKRQYQETLKASDKEAEAEAMLGKLERALAELSQTKDELSQAKADNLRRIEEAGDARDAAAKVRDEADRERLHAREQIKNLEDALSAARDAEARLTAARNELTVRENQLSEMRAEAARRERDIETIRTERDKQTERASLLEHDIATLRADIERLTRHVEAAIESGSRMEARATAAERARASIEHSLRQLREEVFGAFARARASSPPPPVEPTPLAPPPERKPSVTGMAHVSLAPNEAESLPPEAAMDEAPKAAPPPPPPPPPPLPARARRATPPPLSLGLDDAWNDDSQDDAMPPSRKETTPPTAEAMSSLVRAAGPASAQEAPPATARGAATAPPPARDAEEDDRPSSTPEPTRDELVFMLLDNRTAVTAAAALREKPDSLRGIPPQSLVRALATVDYDAEGPIFEIARAWEREPLCHALIKALKKEEDAKLREHNAWLLKHLAAPTAWKALADLARSEEEPMGSRRWLLEALERLAHSKAVGWRELGDLVALLAHHEDASLREGAIGILQFLERSEEKNRVLLEVLEKDDDESVLAAAVHALTGALPMQLDPAVAERLLGHPSPRVQKSVKDFIEKARAQAQG